MAVGFLQLESWIRDFRTKRLPYEAIGQAKLLLLDALGCALAAISDETVRQTLEVVAGVGGGNQARIVGTSMRSSPPNAVFANGVLIRALDLNDYSGGGNKPVGHPSDNIAVALSIGDWQRSSGLDVLTAIVMGYELYSRLQDGMGPKSPWDHTTVAGIVAPAMAGFLMNLDAERMSHALALGAVYCPTLGTIRRGHLSAAKGMANATVAQGAVFQAMLAANGITGPLGALEGTNGLNAVVLSRSGISETFFAGEDQYRIMDAGIKPYPCVGTSQSLVAAALEVRPRVAKGLGEIERIEVAMADLPIVVTQLEDMTRRHPTSREAADHSFYFLPAVALIDGELTTVQFEDRRWEDPRANALMDRMTLRTDKNLNERAPDSFPVRFSVLMRNGQEHVAEVLYHPGHPLNRLDTEGIIGKFSRYNGLKHHKIDWHALTKEVETLDTSRDLDGIFRIVCPGGGRRHKTLNARSAKKRSPMKRRQNKRSQNNRRG
jgi:2-methylcitrate dehydratase